MFKKFVSLTCLMFLILCFSDTFSYSQDQEKIKFVDVGLFSQVERGMKSRQFPSMSVGILDQKNEMSYTLNRKSTIDKQYGIASLTKSFTTLMILQLEEEGKLKIEDAFSKHIPGFTRVERWKYSIKIKHLLSHTSGLRRWRGTRKVKVDKGVYIWVPRQYYWPAIRYHYDNTAFILMKLLIEKITKKSYADNLKERIAVPLEMHNTHGKHANGTSGMVTTIRDLTNYGIMHLNKGEFKGKRIVSEKTYKKLLTPIIKYRTWIIGLDWWAKLKNGKVHSYVKYGRWSGAASCMKIFPEKKLVYVWLNNAYNPCRKSFMGWRWRFNKTLDRTIGKM